MKGLGVGGQGPEKPLAPQLLSKTSLSQLGTVHNVSDPRR